MPHCRAEFCIGICPGIKTRHYGIAWVEVAAVQKPVKRILHSPHGPCPVWKYDGHHNNSSHRIPNHRRRSGLHLVAACQPVVPRMSLSGFVSVAGIEEICLPKHKKAKFVFFMFLVIKIRYVINLRIYF